MYPLLGYRQAATRLSAAARPLPCPIRTAWVWALLASSWGLSSLAIAEDRLPSELSPLASYVTAPDATYSWKIRRQGKLLGTEYAELTLDSQTWREIRWRHQLFVLRPANLPPKPTAAILFIAGGSWKDSLAQPPAADEALPREAALFAALAMETQSPVAILLHVPQQPIFDGKREDEIIAYTFEKYLRTQDPQWPLLFPMVKSAVRGMDAVQEFSRRQWKMPIEGFTVSGASKRGWTTWLTGAVDPRAQTIAPMVIDMLNMGEQLKHQKAAWGKLSYKIDDYTALELDKHLETPAGKRLQALVDPFQYRQKLQQPKLIILGTNDHYWPLDALNLYWNQLEGPKYILYVPNNRHSLNDFPRLTGSLCALHQSVMQRKALPELKWDYQTGDEGVVLNIRCDQRPQQVQCWLAESPTRDFRQAKWTSHLCPETPGKSGRQFAYRLQRPAQGYAAILGEAIFSGERVPFYLSTTVQILGSAAP